MSSLPHSTGQALDRVDGQAKVTGQARYAAEYPAADLLHGSVVSSDVARGRVRGIDCAAALAVPGVVAVLHHLNRPPMAGDDEPYKDADAAEGEPFRPLFDDRVLYSGQPLALVLARSLELARYAGSLLRIDIEPEPHQTDLLAALDQAHEAPAELPAERGDFYTAYRAAPIRVEASYSTPIEHHNPMEPHASTVIVQPDGSLLVHDKTQGTQNSQAYLQKVFGLPADKVRVCAAYVGGAFGSGLRPQYQLALAVMAALQLRRSVRVVLTRQQMFTFGYRPRTLQRLQLGADAEGRLLALGHQATAQTSRFEDFTEHVVEWSGMLYRCENLSLAYRLVPLDVYTPLDMRAPGAALGLIGLECAMDELAVRLGMDPIALRRFNFAERNGNEDKPYSSKALLACYEEGARRFGWQARDPRPRSMSEGRQLLGWGMAGGVWEAMQSKASARAGRPAAGGQRDHGYRHRHLHGDDPDRRRRRWHGAGRGALPAWRQCVAQGSIAGRLVHRLVGRFRRPPGLPAPAPGPGRPCQGPPSGAGRRRRRALPHMPWPSGSGRYAIRPGRPAARAAGRRVAGGGGS